MASRSARDSQDQTRPSRDPDAEKAVWTEALALRPSLECAAPAPRKDLLVVHRHFLHREHRLGAEAADQEVGLVARDDALDGVGRVRHRLDLVGVGPDQLDLHAPTADVDAARLVDLVARHFGACPVVFALHESHRAEDRDLTVPCAAATAATSARVTASMASAAWISSSFTL